jgi:hypothetical protein
MPFSKGDKVILTEETSDLRCVTTNEKYEPLHTGVVVAVADQGEFTNQYGVLMVAVVYPNTEFVVAVKQHRFKLHEAHVPPLCSCSPRDLLHFGCRCGGS